MIHIHQSHNLPDIQSRYGSKTPLPKKITNPTTQKKLISKTTNLNRTFNIYSDENPKSEIEPQRLFKDAIQTPIASRPNSYNLLADKTNTVKKARVPHTSDFKTCSPSSKQIQTSIKKPIQTSQTIPNRIQNITPHPKTRVSNTIKSPQGSPKLLYRTPVTSKRPSRPPILIGEASPELDEFEDHEDENSFDTSIHIDPENLPDMEYGPPTASWKDGESVEVHDWSEFTNLLNGPNAFNLGSFIADHDSMDSTHEILLEDGDKSLWLPEPFYPLPTYRLDLEDSFEGLLSASKRKRGQSTKSITSLNSSSLSLPKQLSSKPYRSTLSVNQKQRNPIPTSLRPQLSIKEPIIKKPTEKVTPEWVEEFNLISKEFKEIEIHSLDSIGNHQDIMGFVNEFLFEI
ncbi:hypothetical protein DFH28DRAFT_899071 [Melampsora americana]|nr:hypothetical protein DFH28DRAFT_899071 [Melampsora americana]